MHHAHHFRQSVGGFDPEATQSTVQMRADLLRETCKLLKLENAKFESRHALIQGEYGRYSVHMSSGVVHKQTGGSLCVVAVNAQHRGRLFLPFADDDPRTAEVISKVLLLARDKESQDPTGQPLLSWRVAILPFIDENPLYNQIKKDEPWDSPHNRQFWNKMPKVYQLPGKPKDDKTYYQVFQGPGSAFPKSKRPGPPFTMGSGLTMVGITDGTSNTIFVVEAANGINWMKPEDIPFEVSPKGFSLASLGNHWGDNTFLAAMGDATVRRFPRTITPQQMQAFVTANGGEAVQLPGVD